MKFHIPSFLHYIHVGLPQDVAMVHHHYIIYLVSFYPLRQDFLQELICRAVIDTFETPLGTPDGTEERSLIEGLLDTHQETLCETLYDLNTYLTKITKHAPRAGEKIRHEYQIDLREIMRIVKEVRLNEDLSLIWDLIRNDYFVSIRLLEKKIFINTGKAFSKRRISEALTELERQNLVKSNGHLRTYGREVIS